METKKMQNKNPKDNDSKGHVLKFRFKPNESQEGELYCEECEEKIDVNDGFWRCDERAQRGNGPKPCKEAWCPDCMTEKEG